MITYHFHCMDITDTIAGIALQIKQTQTQGYHCKSNKFLKILTSPLEMTHKLFYNIRSYITDNSSRRMAFKEKS